jgi:hypothetical protein
MQTDTAPGNDVHARKARRLRAWSARSCAAIGLGAAILAAMTTLAVASTTRGPRTAIPANALAPLMQGVTPSVRAEHARVARRTVAIPHTFAGEQLAWLLGELNGGSATLTASESRSHFGQRFLAVVPPQGVVRFLRGAGDAHGPVTLVGFAGETASLSLAALVETRAHRSYRVRISVQGRSHHLITGVSIDAAMTPRAR